MASFIQVITTTDKREEAERIAQALVEARLAGCVQILGPVTSLYRWQGKVERAGEWLCLVKTREDLYGAVEERIRALHSYETPEIVALPIAAGSGAYLAWLQASLAASGEAK